ncbi:MAG: hypothetical protein WCV55_01825 [Candidatus Paceibacterota bacterium]
MALEDDASWNDERLPECNFKKWLKHHFHRHHDAIPSLETVEEAFQLLQK